MIDNKVSGRKGIEVVKCALTNFTIQTSHTLNCFMRCEAYERRTETNSLRSFGTVHSDCKKTTLQAKVQEEKLNLYLPFNSIIDVVPQIIGHGTKITLIIDYRILYKPRKFYGFYKKAINELINRIKEIDDDVLEKAHNDLPHCGLIGMGPLGFFVNDSEEHRKIIEKQKADMSLEIDGELIKSIKNSLLGFDNHNINVDLYLYFASKLEAKVFSDVYDNINSVDNGIRKLIVGDIEIVEGSKSIQILPRIIKDNDVVIVLTIDPLPLLYPFEVFKRKCNRNEILYKLIIIHYVAPYINLANEYYQKLRTVGRDKYLEIARSIPLIDITTFDNHDKCRDYYRLRKLNNFVDILPIGNVRGTYRQICYDIFTPDVFITRYDLLKNIVKNLYTHILELQRLLRIEIMPSNNTSNANTIKDLIEEAFKIEIPISILKKSKQKAISELRSRIVTSKKMFINEFIIQVDDLRRYSD